MTTLVLTVVGDDRVGLIKALADVVSANGGNWERSHLAELEGTFAGVVLVSVPDHAEAQLRAALAPLDGLLDISARPTAGSGTAGSATAGSGTAGSERTTPRRARLELIGNDRPGIVAAVSDVLVRHGIGVSDLQTSTREAPMAGGLLFEASAIIAVDPDVSLDALQADLELLAAEILVDLSVTDLG